MFLTNFGILSVIHGFYAETIIPRLQLAEGDTVYSLWQAYPMATVHGIKVVDSFGVIELPGGKFDAECIVRVR